MNLSSTAVLIPKHELTIQITTVIGPWPHEEKCECENAQCEATLCLNVELLSALGVINEWQCTRVCFWLPVQSISVSIIPKAEHVSCLDWNLSTNFIHLFNHRQMFRMSKKNEPRQISSQFIALPLWIGRQSNVKRRCFEMHRQRHTWSAQESRNRAQRIKLFSYVVEIDCVRPKGTRCFFFNSFASPEQIYLVPSSHGFHRSRNE